MVKKIIGMVLALLSVTVVGVGVFAYTIYQQGTETLAKTYKKIGEETKVIEATEPLTILLMEWTPEMLNELKLGSVEVIA